MFPASATFTAAHTAEVHLRQVCQPRALLVVGKLYRLPARASDFPALLPFLPLFSGFQDVHQIEEHPNAL